MIPNNPFESPLALHDMNQRLVHLQLENDRQWPGRTNHSPLVPPDWLGGPWTAKNCPSPCSGGATLRAAFTPLKKCDGTGTPDTPVEIDLTLSSGVWSGTGSASTDYGDFTVRVNCGRDGVTATVTRECTDSAVARYSNSELLASTGYAAAAGNPAWAGSLKVYCFSEGDPPPPPDECPCFDVTFPGLTINCTNNPADDVTIPAVYARVAMSTAEGGCTDGYWADDEGRAITVSRVFANFLFLLTYNDGAECSARTYYVFDPQTGTVTRTNWNEGGGNLPDDADWPNSTSITVVDCADPPPTNSGTASGSSGGCGETETPMFVWSQYGGSYPGWYPLSYPCLSPCFPMPPDRPGAYEGEVAAGNCVAP